jgi:hypothetical protein
MVTRAKTPTPAKAKYKPLGPSESCSEGKHRLTRKLLAKFVMVASARALPRTLNGNTSPQSNQEIGPKETWYAPT